MKYIFVWTLTVLLTLVSTHLPAKTSEASSDSAQLYFTEKEMPDLLKILPPPPDTLSQAFTYDIMQYMWGKTQRLNHKRAAIAIRDSEFSMRRVCLEFSEPFGMRISKTETPEIYRLLLDAIATCDASCYTAKNYYMRKRPFMYMQEPTLTPRDEKNLIPNGSYPSGHAILGWSTALILTEINPDRADTLLARGYMFGESRVIVGAHWQSDIDAGRLAASIALAKLHSSKRFLEQMEKAKTEFLLKSETGIIREEE